MSEVLKVKDYPDGYEFYEFEVDIIKYPTLTESILKADMPARINETLPGPQYQEIIFINEEEYIVTWICGGEKTIENPMGLSGGFTKNHWLVFNEESGEVDFVSRGFHIPK